MASQGLRLMKRFYHPQPVGWLVTLVSAAALLWGAWQLGSWQAREAERGA